MRELTLIEKFSGFHDPEQAEDWKERCYNFGEDLNYPVEILVGGDGHLQFPRDFCEYMDFWDGDDESYDYAPIGDPINGGVFHAPSVSSNKCLREMDGLSNDLIFQGIKSYRLTWSSL